MSSFFSLSSHLKFEVTFGRNELNQFQFTLKMASARKDKGWEPGRMGAIGGEEMGGKWEF